MQTWSKQTIALVSLVSGMVLALIKFGVAYVTGSLSILAEAVDTLLDLVASSVALLAVRIADVPPDDDHPYGHARAENLGALAQTVLLIVTALWIVWQALERLFFVPAIPTITLWSFLIIVVSLVINAVRVVLLHRAAHTNASEALHASAANFATDMIGSLVVLVSIAVILAGQWLNLAPALLTRIDPLAAIIVALLALHTAWHLGQRSIHILMDGIPGDLNQRLTNRIGEIPIVVPNSTQVRARFVGEQPYVEVIVAMPRGHSLEEAHELADTVEDAVRAELDAANVLVHVEPARVPAEPYTTTVYSVAQQLGLRVHHLDVYQLSDGMRVEMDLELPGSLTLAEAHTYSEQLEAAIEAELPAPATIVVHLEPRHDQVQPAVRYPPVHEKVQQVLHTLPNADSILHAETLLADDGIIVAIHCHFPGQTQLTDVHMMMARMEHDLLRAMPDVTRVQIDPEPSECLHRCCFYANGCIVRDCPQHGDQASLMSSHFLSE